VLKPSTLVCLAGEPVINVTRGCAHRCVYCYARAYPEYPGDDRVQLYVNLAEKVADELARKRHKPGRVHFSSSSDGFGPYAEVQRQTHRVMRVLLRRGIRVSFLTKGYIRRPFYRLFREYRGLIRATIGLVSVDDGIARLLEPGAAPPRKRLRNLRRLCRMGISTSVRIDPMVPELTDSARELRRLLAAVSRCGVRRVSASYLFLRPAIRRRLACELRPDYLRDRILDCYQGGPRIVHRANPDGCGITALPAWRRERGFDRLRALAQPFGITVSICGCKNTDLGIEDSCSGYRDDGSETGCRQLLLF